MLSNVLAIYKDYESSVQDYLSRIIYLVEHSHNLIAVWHNDTCNSYHFILLVSTM